MVKDCTNIDIQGYRPVILFLNGDFWGVYNIREKLDNNYLVAHHGVNTDNIDYLEYDLKYKKTDLFKLLNEINSKTYKI